MNRFRVLAAMLASAVLAGPAWAAPTPAQVARDFGLLGAWAEDCARPAAAGNLRSTYAATPDGGVKVIDDMGRQGVQQETVSRLRRLGPDRLAFLQGPKARPSSRLVIERRGDRYHVVESVERQHGHDVVLIHEGKLADDGTESPWFKRCPVRH